jgi:hypothetical protein
MDDRFIERVESVLHLSDLFVTTLPAREPTDDVFRGRVAVEHQSAKAPDPPPFGG